jgi:hypothetical protein
MGIDLLEHGDYRDMAIRERMAKLRPLFRGEKQLMSSILNQNGPAMATAF